MLKSDRARGTRLTPCILLPALLLTAVPAFGQAENSQRDFVTNYLAQKRAEFLEVDRNLEQTGKLPARNGLLAVIRAQNPLQRQRLLGSSSQRHAVEDALLQTLANYLAAVGFLPNDVQALRRLNVDIIEAGREVLLGSPSFLQQAAVAEAVVLARVDGLANEGGSDGFGSTLTATIEKSYKGAYEVGEKLSIRQISGIQQGVPVTVSGEIGNEGGQRYLLFVSPSLYATRTGTRRGASAGGGPAVHQMAPYLLQNEVLRATTLGQIGDGTSLSGFESAVAPVVSSN